MKNTESSKAGYTPGPWSCDESGFGTVIAEGGAAICRVHLFACSDGKANARLIAAAPALVEALKGLLPEAGKNFSNSDTWDRHRKAIAALRAAGVEP